VGIREAASKVIEEGRVLIIGISMPGFLRCTCGRMALRMAMPTGQGTPPWRKRCSTNMEFHMGYLEAMVEVLDGIPIDVVHMADDFAGQNGMLISPGSYRRT